MVSTINTKETGNTKEIGKNFAVIVETGLRIVGLFKVGRFVFLTIGSSEDGQITTEVDVVIIGAGIAGASLGAALASKKNVVLLEQESQPGYHTTGRSAAIYTEVYGNEIIRLLTSASREFFQNPPEGFAEVPLWHDIETFLIGTKDQKSHVDELYENVRNNAPGVENVDGAEYEALIPIVKPGVVGSAVKDAQSKMLDVGAIHQGFLKRCESSGGKVVTNAEVKGLHCEDEVWTVETDKGLWAAPIVVNAAGAWAEKIAGLAGASPVGLTPLRRTVCVVDVPQDVDVTDWPMTVDVEDQFYFKPESGRILCSPADETPSEPCDAQPEEIDVAIAIDRVQGVLDLDVRRIESKWAGLRTFASDKTPVVGFDPVVAGFFWLAGQGGYGIQTSPAMAEVAAALILGNALPQSVTSRGVVAEMLSPARFNRALEASG